MGIQLFGLKATNILNQTKKIIFEVRFTMWSDFQAKKLNARGELELDAKQAEVEN